MEEGIETYCERPWSTSSVFTIICKRRLCRDLRDSGSVVALQRSLSPSVLRSVDVRTKVSFVCGRASPLPGNIVV
jgi:hypothetical protein